MSRKTAKRRPPGRPPGTDYVRIDVRLMPAQIAALDAHARCHGVSLAEAVRRCIDGELGLVPVRGIVPAVKS